MSRPGQPTNAKTTEAIPGRLDGVVGRVLFFKNGILIGNAN